MVNAGIMMTVAKTAAIAMKHWQARRVSQIISLLCDVFWQSLHWCVALGQYAVQPYRRLMPLPCCQVAPFYGPILESIVRNVAILAMLLRKTGLMTRGKVATDAEGKDGEDLEKWEVEEEDRQHATALVRTHKI